MSRKVFLLYLILLIAALSACSVASGGKLVGTPSGQEGESRLPAGEHTFDELRVSADETVFLDGDVVIHVNGPITIEGTLSGDCVRVEIRGTEDLLLDGLITNVCMEETAEAPQVRLIAEGDITLGAEASDEPVIISDGSVFVSDPGGEALDLAPILLDEDSSIFQARGIGKLAAPLRQGGGTTTVNRPVRAGRGQDSTFVRETGNHTQPNDLTAQDGQDAPELGPIETCDNSNSWGGSGGSVRIAVRNGTLTIKGGVTLKAGDGGKGGSCVAEGCPAAAAGGRGGSGGSVLLGGQGIVFEAGVTIIRGNGGEGGDAEATGDDGQNACDAGCNATATSGEGGPAGGVGYLLLLPSSIQGAPNVEGANGGKGGLASAFGGDGSDCDTCIAGHGGRGGDAIATGGQGGNGGRAISDWGFQPGSHLKGDGGDAIAVAGFGGYGATCCMPPDVGGDGGDGGEATAIGGQPGVRGAGGGGQRGSSAGSLTGDGGDGGDGDPPGMGGMEGPGMGDPDPVTFGDPGVDGELCPIKVWDVYIAVLDGTWVHFLGFSEVHVLIFIVGDDPVPMPNANVTLTMTGQSGYSQTMTVTTGPDGIASGSFKIFAYDTYTVTVSNVEGENMSYDPSRNVTDAIVLEVGPGEGSLPDVSDAMVEAFIEAIGRSVRKQDTAFLFNHLHPEVLVRYGNNACQAYLSGLTDPTFNVQVLEVTGPEPWDYERDERTSAIPLAFTVSANVTSQGETKESELHVALEPPGMLHWFTDCGEPLQ